MMTNEQIEAEINELRLEIERRVAVGRGVFAQVAELECEASILKRVLSQRSKVESKSELISLVFLGFVCGELCTPTLVCALTWAGSRDLPANIRIFVRRKWRTLLPDDILSYFSDLLEDWKLRIRSDPAVVVAGIEELSVGPVRATEESIIRKGHLLRALEEQLGDIEEYQELAPVK
jgi:hypothetical protein